MFEGLLGAHDDSYRERRTFFIKNVLKDFAAQGDSIEERILQEVKLLGVELEAKKGVPITIHDFFNRHILNSLLSVLVSMRFEPDDPRFNELLHGLNKYASNQNCYRFPNSMLAIIALLIHADHRVTSIEGVRDILSIYIPTLAEWFPNFMGYTPRLQAGRKLLDFFRQILKERRGTRVKGMQRDLLHVYLETMAGTTDPNSSFYHEKGSSWL